jgi:hypothetical protein
LPARQAAAEIARFALRLHAASIFPHFATLYGPLT